MKTFLELKKNCKRDMGQAPAIRLALLGNCATQLLATAVRGAGVEEGLNLQILDMDYNQILPQTMDPHSELYESKPAYVLLQICAEKLWEEFCGEPLEQRASFAQRRIEEIIRYWDDITRYSSARILQFDFVELNDQTFGSYGLKVHTSFISQIRRLNVLLMDEAEKRKNVFLLNLAAAQAELGRKQFFDEKYYYSAKMPISLTALPEVAKLVIDMVKVLQGKIKKCIVLDLDNTLWGGVIGDDGMSGIQIGELGSGHAFSNFQLWLRELKNRGVVLAVCSKNNEDTAREPFQKHPDMTLKIEDISIFIANWQDKAGNIKMIQQTLNLGMDSFVFLDDNPFERNMVSSMIPEITVPELPEDPAGYLAYVQSLNLFETASFSSEDQNRTSQYQAEIGRVTLQRQYESIDDYLKSLEMIAEVKPFDEFQYPRIAQLTQRSNQFNLRTVRYTEEEIAKVAQDDSKLTLYFTLRDKFGDHGLISVVILDKQDDKLFVDTWLMSCRVLKRGMEEFIVNQIVETARANGFAKVVGEYLKTPKNAMVEHIYEKLGFDAIGENQFAADIEKFKLNRTFITKENAK